MNGNVRIIHIQVLDHAVAVAVAVAILALHVGSTTSIAHQMSQRLTLGSLGLAISPGLSVAAKDGELRFGSVWVLILSVITTGRTGCDVAVSLGGFLAGTPWLLSTFLSPGG